MVRDEDTCEQYKQSNNRVLVSAKDKWKCCLGGYIFGYTLPILMADTIDLKSFFPIKLMAILMAMSTWEAVYWGPRVGIAKMNMIATKLVLKFAVLLIVVVLLHKIILLSFNFDILPYLWTEI